MKTKLKDVLHLYLGCECKFIGKDRFFIKNGELITLMSSDIDRLSHEGEFIPVLRPLSSITVDELNEVEEILGVLNANHFVNAWVNNTPYSISIHNMVELTNLLRKKYFDMDYLIESKQAVLQTQLK